MALELRRLLFSIFVIILLLAGGMTAVGWQVSTKPKATQTSDVSLAPLVKTLRVSLEDKQEYFTGYGTARAEVDAVLASEVRGVVVEIAEGLNEGDHVRKGQMLLRIDDRQYRQQSMRAAAMADELLAQLDQLKVEKQNLERLMAISESEVEVNYNEMIRLAGLFEKNQASKKEYDFARLAYQQSKRLHVTYENQIALIDPRRSSLNAQHAARRADAEMAKLDVQRCEITAPFDGEVVEVSVDAGDHVQLGGQVVRLMSTRIIEVPIELPASVRSNVQVGADCRLEADTMTGSYWVGRIARIAPLSDELNRTFSAYVEVDNDTQEAPLVPGVFLTAQVEGPLHRQVLAIPRGALVDGSVFIVNDERVHARRVQIDRIVDEWALVTGELKPGDRLVITNLDLMTEGLLVRVNQLSMNTWFAEPGYSNPFGAAVASRLRDFS